MRTKLSAHFYLDELLVSDAAHELGIVNTPTAPHLEHIEKYLVPGLEEVRVICGNRAMVLTSAYRNPKVNAAVGGTATSAHPLGYAGDCHFSGLTDQAAARLIAAAMKARKIKIDQLIWEDGRCVHVSFDPRARMMMGRQKGKAGTPIDWTYFDG